MNAQRIIPFLFPTTGSLYKLLNNILTLEHQLKNSEQQSEYFRWALLSKQKLLNGFYKRFEEIRTEFNSLNKDDIQNIIKENQTIMSKKAQINPLFVRFMIQRSTVNQILKYSEFLDIKSFTDVLPTLDELRQNLGPL